MSIGNYIFSNNTEFIRGKVIIMFRRTEIALQTSPTNLEFY